MSAPPQQEAVYEGNRAAWSARASASILSERHTNDSPLHQSATPRSDVPDDFHVPIESRSSTDEAAGTGERSESSVLAGLSGADSAMDITKKVFDCRPILFYEKY